MDGSRRILPFLWHHGEDEGVVREEIGRIAESGAGSFCVESRPHPDFCGPGWWRDFDAVMDEAARRGMRVWLLDDSHFPSGYANGLLKARYPERAKRYLSILAADACGPLAGAAFPLASRLGYRGPFGGAAKGHADRLVALVACRREASAFASPLDLGSSLNASLGGGLGGGLLRWDVPPGLWRLFLVVETSSGGGDPDYVNPIDRLSASTMIEAVYEPHYARYGSEFGRTFAGFFSDESSMGNNRGYSFDEDIGRKPGMVLPWSAELEAKLRSSLGAGFPLLLPFLWVEGPDSPIARYAYMDAATALYRDDYSSQIGDWCRERGVEFIGHAIEDNGEHARLGAGCGHYFRALAGQDWAGVDVVIQQLLPGFDEGGHAYFGGEWDGPFFHYGLAKLASSLAHLDPRMKGRAFCEIFGAYGWSEGTRLMKWLVDHMLVRGINRLVPHAFDPKDYPDPDCPPHFYARGRNPLFRHFGTLMRYAGRLCELFDGGSHVAPAAVLYHAAAQWCGDCMPCEGPGRELAEAQIDYDFVPEDLLSDRARYGARAEGGALRAGGEAYRVLLAPGARVQSAAAAELLLAAAEAGVAAAFVGKAPARVVDASGDRPELLAGVSSLPELALHDIAGFCRDLGIAGPVLGPGERRLRHYRYAKEGAELHLLFNEEPHRAIEAWIELPRAAGPGGASILRYDAFEDSLHPVEAEAVGEGRLRLRLELAAYESAVFVVGGLPPCLGAAARSPRAMPTSRGEALALEGPWRASFARAPDLERFGEALTLERLVDISTVMEGFSGAIRYEAEIGIEEAEACLAGEALLDLGEVYDCAELRVNGASVGARICPPYRFEVDGLLRPGANRLEVVATTSLAREHVDFLSGQAALEPVGLIGPVSIHVKEVLCFSQG